MGLGRLAWPRRMAYFLERAGHASTILHLARPELCGRCAQGKPGAPSSGSPSCPTPTPRCSWPSPTRGSRRAPTTRITWTRMPWASSCFEHYVHGRRGRRAQDAEVGRGDVRRAQLHHQGPRALLGRSMPCPSPTANGGGMHPLAVLAHEPARLEIALFGHAGPRPSWHRPAPPHRVRPVYGFDECESPASLREVLRGARSLPWVDGDDRPTRHSCPKPWCPRRIMLPEGEKLRWYGHVVCTAPREDQFIPFEFPVDGAPMIHMIWSDSP